uniref:AlNc14C96G5881 protein n=1 Tax=Albugo laibachii Nc14 TaxID=890382 RepID=F0WH06_9STRA|nr:AlNc14C96G5881 [Albugo laibachii Nc14]|eukprot:CCA20521.1 AlNc14C96G5881 [Albugo laibachii Nc14]
MRLHQLLVSVSIQWLHFTAESIDHHSGSPGPKTITPPESAVNCRVYKKGAFESDNFDLIVFTTQTHIPSSKDAPRFLCPTHHKLPFAPWKEHHDTKIVQLDLEGIIWRNNNVFHITFKCMSSVIISTHLAINSELYPMQPIGLSWKIVYEILKITKTDGSNINVMAPFLIFDPSVRGIHFPKDPRNRLYVQKTLPTNENAGRFRRGDKHYGREDWTKVIQHNDWIKLSFIPEKSQKGESYINIPWESKVLVTGPTESRAWIIGGDVLANAQLRFSQFKKDKRVAIGFNKKRERDNNQ